MKITIPNTGELELQTVILDLNGTLTIRGILIEGVQERLEKLKQKGFSLFLFSGDTRGTAKSLADTLGLQYVYASTGEEKRRASLELNPATCVAIGNGFIDVPLFREVGLSIATLQAEGVHREALKEADITVPSIVDALDVLLDEQTLISTLRA